MSKFVYVIALLLVAAFPFWGPAPILITEQGDPLAPAPAVLPRYLSDSNVADAPAGLPAPVVDGWLAPGEYAQAHRLSFAGYLGTIDAFVVQNAITLTIGLDSRDTTPYPYNSGGGTGPAIQVFLDGAYDRSSKPQADDFRLTVFKNGTLQARCGDGVYWGACTSIAGIRTSAQVTPWGWQAEVSIGLAQLGLTPPTTRVVGFALAEVWTVTWPWDWYWPQGANWENPSTWGHLVSSSSWTTFDWKPGPWKDYALSGMPDFDQTQDAHWSVIVAPPPPTAPAPPSQVWTHCGPVAAANSLWWFDSKFEPLPELPPAVQDGYRLVHRYGTQDDHDPVNVAPLVDDLASYFGTNQGLVGTDVISMSLGLQQYLRERGLWDDFRVTLEKRPSYAWVAEEVRRSEDVILLLGFWELLPTGGYQRVGGHYVTVAGVGQAGPTQAIAFSDPLIDAQEAGLSILPGRVLSGTLRTHIPIPGHAATVHNDAGNISHDLYAVVESPSPGGTWGPADYPWKNVVLLMPGANPHPDFETFPYHGEPVSVEVEFALAVSPFRWKSSGDWDSVTGSWKPRLDYAPNGMPDFGQKQGGWIAPLAASPAAPDVTIYSFCGPAAAANSLWWFDTRQEHAPLMPPAVNDHFGLVVSQGGAAGAWDDHDPRNVDAASTAWPPGAELVEDLAVAMHTDTIGRGTIITGMVQGLATFFDDRKLAHWPVISQVQRPEFWWAAQEVERSEDVILLLGFYKEISPGSWQRLGGHYVTLAGVDRQGGFVAFSDPWLDRAEQSWPFAGDGPIAGWPLYMGRMDSGTLIPHVHPVSPPDTTHNDAGNISHDIYHVTALPVAAPGSWAIEGYANSTSLLNNFIGQNGGGVGPPTGQYVTVVEWAAAVSPKLWRYLPLIRK